MSEIQNLADRYKNSVKIIPEEFFDRRIPEYRGFVEHNGTEGEDYGYYFPISKNTFKLLDTLEKIFSKYDALTGKPDGYSIEPGKYTLRDLEMISKGAKNRYRKRCHIVTNLKLLELLVKVDDNESLPYFGIFTVDGKEYDLKSQEI